MKTIALDANDAAPETSGVELVCLAPIQVAVRLWPTDEGTFLVVVAKATYDLEPETCPLADVQLPLNRADVYTGPERARSVRALSDLVPFKRTSDVLLTGRGYGHPKRPGETTRTAVTVGEVRRTFELLARPFSRRGGELGETMRLLEEPRPSGGKGLGVPTGIFGFEVRSLADDLPMTLENLHPAHLRLVTRLPGVRPRAFTEEAERLSNELRMKADTLWIDSDHSLCTLTWRAHIPFDRLRNPVRVIVALQHPNQELTLEETRPAPESLSLVTRDESPRDDNTDEGPSDEREPERKSLTSIHPTGRADHMPWWVAAPRSSEMPPPPSAEAISGHDPASIGQPEVPPWPQPPSESRASISSPLLPPPASAYAASNAAALGEATERSTKASGLRRIPLGHLLELLCFEPSAVAKGRAAFRHLLLDAAVEAKEEPADPSLSPAELRQQIEEADLFTILRAGPLTDPTHLEGLIAELADGSRPYRAPLFVVEGDLEIVFDELEVLKKLVALVESIPHAHAVALEEARAALASPAFSDLGRAIAKLEEGHEIERAARLREALERALMDERKYTCRPVFGGTQVVTRFSSEGSSDDMPLYVSEALKSKLPSFRSLPVRLLVELHARQDPFEPSAWSLRLLAAARRIPLPFSSRS